MSLANPEYLQSISGKVVNVYPGSAVVASDLKGSKLAALVWLEELINDDGSKTCGDNKSMEEHLSIGMKVVLKCRMSLPVKDDEGVQSYRSIIALRQEPCDRQVNSDFHFGVVHAIGTLSLLHSTGGVLEFEFTDGKKEKVIFTKSDVQLNGQTLGAKQRVDKAMKLTVLYNFDAIPVNPLENEHSCPWGATRVWQGENETKAIAAVTDNLALELRSLSRDPCRIFWRSYGHVWTVISDEIAIVLGRWKANHYESVLVHRIFFTVGAKKIPNVSLHELFKKGDRMQFVAFPAPAKFMVKWIASHVSPDMDGHLRDSLNVMP